MTDLKTNPKKPKSKAGGVRPGSGRKKGSVTNKTRIIAEQAMKEGITPIEVMLKNMRWADEQSTKLGKESPEGAAMRKVAQDAAKDAAPYLHPRLASTETVIQDKRSRNELIARADELNDRYGTGRVRSGDGSEKSKESLGKLN